MTPEFSKLIDTGKLDLIQKSFTFSANQEEREALANRFNILSIDAFDTTVDIISLKDQDPFMRLDIHLCATVTQQCVVSLRPLEEKIDKTFSILLSHAEEDMEEAAGLLELAKEEHEIFYMGGADIIDIGEILSQYLSLFMDPYPRHPDAALNQHGLPQTKPSPLHQLKDLKKDLP